MPATLLGETVSHAQAQAGTVAFRLGGEKGFEGLLDDLGRHADAGVGHRQQHVLTGRHVGLGARIEFVEHGVAQFQGQLAALGHGIAGIDRQVEHHLLELVRIDHGGPQAAGDHGFDLDVLADGLAQQLVEIAQQPAEVGRLRPQRLAAGKGQQLARQLGTAFDCRAGSIDALGRAAVLLHQRLQQLQIAGDHLQHVVEIMGHAARELADGLELLRLVQRLPAQLQLAGAFLDQFLQPLAGALQGLLRQHLGGDVMTLAENTGNSLVLAEYRLENEVEVASLGLATGLRAHAHGEVAAEIGPPGNVDLLQQLGQRTALQLRKGLECRAAEQFAGTNQLMEGAVGDLQFVARPFGDGDEARCLVEQPLQMRALLVESAPVQLAGAALGHQCRHIAQGQGSAHHGTIRRTDRGHDDLQGAAADGVLVLQRLRRVAVQRACQRLVQLRAPERQTTRGTTQHLGARKAEQLGRAGTPVEHRAGPVEADDRITRGIDEVMQIELRRWQRPPARLTAVHRGIGPVQRGPQTRPSPHAGQRLIELLLWIGTQVDDGPVGPEQGRRAQRAVQRVGFAILAEKEDLRGFPVVAQLSRQGHRARQSGRQQHQRRLFVVRRQCTCIQAAQLQAVRRRPPGDLLMQAAVIGLQQRDPIEQQGAHSSGTPSRLRPVQSLSSPVVGVITWPARASRSNRAARLFSR